MDVSREDVCGLLLLRRRNNIGQRSSVRFTVLYGVNCITADGSLSMFRMLAQLHFRNTRAQLLGREAETGPFSGYAFLDSSLSILRSFVVFEA
jgi:hypothetical protein